MHSSSFRQGTTMETSRLAGASAERTWAASEASCPVSKAVRDLPNRVTDATSQVVIS